MYEVIFIPNGVEAPAREIINAPELQVYVKDFGKQEGDICFVAEVEEKNITQAEFAKRVGIATSTVSEWKKKKTNPSADKIMDICVALDVAPDVLLTGRGIDEEKGFAEAERNDRMTPVDWQLIEDFHGMKEEQKRRLLKYMETLKQLEKLEELE